MKVVKPVLPEGYAAKYPWCANEHLLFLGEIENMAGHCAVANHEGKVFWAYHTEIFEDVDKNET